MKSNLTPAQNEVLDLRDRVADLEEEVRMLKALLHGEELIFPREWGLHHQERQALRSLYSSPTGFRRAEALRLVISFSESTSIEVLRVTISRLRRKLRPLGVVISPVKHEGYQLSAESKAILQAILPQPSQVAA